MENRFGITKKEINFINLTFDVKDYIEALENHMLMK